jgi:pimeloyl-ACP methyl ester carboxylesterase
MFGSPWHESYLKHAPRKEDFATILAKIQQCIAREPYDWTEQFGALTMPVLIIVGDADSVSVSHAAEMFERVGGGGSDGFANGKPRSRLLVLPGTHHLDVTSRVEHIVPAVDAFLDAEETSSEPFVMP